MIPLCKNLTIILIFIATQANARPRTAQLKRQLNREHLFLRCNNGRIHYIEKNQDGTLSSPFFIGSITQQLKIPVNGETFEIKSQYASYYCHEVSDEEGLESDLSDINYGPGSQRGKCQPEARSCRF